jgi:hypothetical protein
MQRNQKITFFHPKKSLGKSILDIFGLSISEKLFDFFVFDFCNRPPYNLYVTTIQSIWDLYGIGAVYIMWYDIT